MPTYPYRCARCGPFDVVRSMTAGDADPSCPDCGDAARRVFSPPAVRRVAPALNRALGAQERSAHEPAVVTEVPSAGRPARVTTDPRHAALPRP